jgi:hypothetical protein
MYSRRKKTASEANSTQGVGVRTDRERSDRIRPER